MWIYHEGFVKLSLRLGYSPRNTCGGMKRILERMKALQCDTIEWMNKDNLAMHQVLEERTEAIVIYLYNNKRMLTLQSYTWSMWQCMHLSYVSFCSIMKEQTFKQSKNLTITYVYSLNLLCLCYRFVESMDYYFVGEIGL